MPYAALVLALLVSQDGRAHLPGWNATFAVPSGWRVLQISGRGAALSDSLESSAVFVAATFLTTRTEALAELGAMFADLHYTPTATVVPKDTTIAARRAMVASYRGAGRAGLVETRAAVVFTAHGTAVTILGLASPDRFPAVAAIVTGVAASLDASPPVTNAAWVSGLSGHWDYVGLGSAADTTGQVTHEEWLEFDGRERFTWRSRTIVRLPGAAAAADGEDDTGTYTVVGNTLVLRGKTKARALDGRLAGDELHLGSRAFRRRP